MDLEKIKRALTPECREELAAAAMAAQGAVESLLSNHPSAHVLDREAAREAMTAALVDMIKEPSDPELPNLGKPVYQWPTAKDVARRLIANLKGQDPTALTAEETEAALKANPETVKRIHRAIRDYDLPEIVLMELEQEVAHIARMAEHAAPEEEKGRIARK